MVVRGWRSWYVGTVMRTADLDYDLPEELVAQRPCPRRDEARLLVVDRASGAVREDVFRNIASHFAGGDCLVLNDTRVIRARLHGAKPSGGKVEVFLLREVEPAVWEALVRPSARVKPGTPVRFGPSEDAIVDKALPGGRRRVIFRHPNVLQVLESTGEVPLPPYIRRRRPDDTDLTRYQTIYGRTPGAVAAPTAGLHFTDEVFESLTRAGVHRVMLTLHVGYGTFTPIRAEHVEDHSIESEEFDFPQDAARLLNRTREEGGRVVAVGTTCTRVLEAQFHEGAFRAGKGFTDQYIYPPYTFRAVDMLQTNFHLPRSSLLALVCAFAGRDLIFEAYRYAIKERFRFYSYGDAMLIL